MCWVGFMYSWTGSSEPNHSYPNLPSKFFVHLKLSYLSTGHPTLTDQACATVPSRLVSTMLSPLPLVLKRWKKLLLTRWKVRCAAASWSCAYFLEVWGLIGIWKPSIPAGSEDLTLAIHKHSFQCARLVLLIPRIVLILFICPHSLLAHYCRFIVN